MVSINIFFSFPPGVPADPKGLDWESKRFQHNPGWCVHHWPYFWQGIYSCCGSKAGNIPEEKDLARPWHLVPKFVVAEDMKASWVEFMIFIFFLLDCTARSTESSLCCGKGQAGTTAEDCSGRRRSWSCQNDILFHRFQFSKHALAAILASVGIFSWLDEWVV